MKRMTVLGSLLVLSLSGCMSGNVAIHGPGDEASGSGSAAPSVGHQSQGSTMGSSTTNETALAAAQTVYFETYHSTGLHDSWVGLGFLAIDAQQPTPFGFNFPLSAQAVSAQVQYWRPVLIGNSEEVAWIESMTESSQTGMSELEILDPSSSTEPQSRMTVPQAQSYALAAQAPAGGTPALAAIDPNGKLFVIGSSGQEQAGKSGFSEGSQVDWIGGASRIAVTDPVARTISIFSTTDLVHPKSTLQGDAFSASPEGHTYVVFTESTGGHLSVVDAATGKSRALGVTISSFEEPSWSGENTVAFVNGTEAATEVDVLSMSSGSSAAAGTISATYPDSAPVSGWNAICPAWVGGQLFFAGADAQGNSAIWEAGGAGSTATEFAVPSEEGQGFACPKGMFE